MTITISLVLYILAFVCFFLAALRVASQKTDLVAAGLALFTLGFLFK